jgi:hypothetical protein
MTSSLYTDNKGLVEGHEELESIVAGLGKIRVCFEGRN